MKAAVIFESLTGNTRKAGERIAEGFRAEGVDVTTVDPLRSINLQALAEADLVIVGGWTDGLILFGQRPGMSWKLRAMPTLAGKKALVYATYALEAGRVVPKLSAIVESRGAEVLGGLAIKRNKLAQGAEHFVTGALESLKV